MSAKLISIAKAAARLDVSESTIRRMCKDVCCELVAVRLYRGCWRVDVASLERLIAARTIAKSEQLLQSRQ
jgi:DeoR/GlpR family transcriptional regulator of sugar metabolism